MSEKVKLPKQVCDALDKLQYKYSKCDILYRNMNSRWVGEYEVINDIDEDLLMIALVLGYEPELSAEEQIKELYMRPPTKGYENSNRREHEKSYCGGMLDTLEILGIHYDWMEDAE